MINVAGHLREQNGTYQMVLSWKDETGKRRTKSISTGLPVKGNKKRAESLLRQTQKEFNPETMQQVGDLSVPEYLTRWLRESVMNLSPDTYGRYAYDMGRVIIPYFERKRLSLKALTPRDLETFFRYERQQEEATVQQLLDWHRELTDALQYAVDSNWLKANPVKTVDPCLDNSPVLFNDFLMDWLKMMKSRVAITTYANYEIVITRRIVPYFEPLHYTLQDLEQHPKYIQDFYQHELDRGVTANTVIHYHANIRKCLQYAFQIGMIRSNPADRVERPRKEKFKSEVYKAEELEQLFTAIQGDPAEFGVIMAAFYGLRRSEIVGLKWDAIDFENKKRISIELPQQVLAGRIVSDGRNIFGSDKDYIYLLNEDKSVKRITRGSDVISVQDEVLYYVFNGKLCQYDLNAQTNSQVQNGPDLLEYDLIDPDSFYTIQNKYFVGCRLSVFAYSDSHSILTYTTIYDLQHGKKYLFMGNLGRIAKNFQILNAD